MQKGGGGTSTQSASTSTNSETTPQPAASRDLWYFTKEELHNSISVRDGIPLSTEIAYRKSACAFMQEAGMKLRIYLSSILLHISIYDFFFLVS
jgi:cyclin T